MLGVHNSITNSIVQICELTPFRVQPSKKSAANRDDISLLARIDAALSSLTMRKTSARMRQYQYRGDSAAQSLASCAKMLFQTTSLFVRNFGRPDALREVGYIPAGASPVQSEQQVLLFSRELHELFHLGLRLPQLRDEIFVHILKVRSHSHFLPNVVIVVVGIFVGIAYSTSTLPSSEKTLLTCPET